MHRNDADLLALGRQIIDRLLDGLRDGTHRHDDIFGILGTIVYERLVFATGDFRNLLHRIGNHVGHRIVELVGSLARLEIDIGILRRTARHGMLGVQRTLAERFQRVAVEHRSQRSLVDELDFLNLVRRTEAVEEVHERYAGFQRHDVSDTGQIHDLLHRRRSQHGETGLTGGHDVLMVAEDRQRLSGQSASRNVEYAREQFAGDLVHVGDHQQQTLRSSERRSQRTALQRTVHGTGGTGLGLHFDHLDGLAENVLATLCGPLVDEFGHGRRGRDGINSCHFGEHVSHMCRSVVTITGNEFLFCHFVYELKY